MNAVGVSFFLLLLTQLIQLQALRFNENVAFVDENNKITELLRQRRRGKHTEHNNPFQETG